MDYIDRKYQTVQHEGIFFRIIENNSRISYNFSSFQSLVLGLLVFAFMKFENGHAIQVVDIAGRHASVGAHGPALVNFLPRYTLPYGYADVFIGPPAGTSSIGLNTGIFRAHGFIPQRHQYDG